MCWFLRLSCLWPGLPGLWSRGKWEGLAVAIGFAALLNVAILAGGPMALPWQWPAVLWTVAAAVWSLGVWRNFAALSAEVAYDSSGAADDDLFSEAQAEYLKGNWVAAERFLNERLAKAPEDADSRLLLATLLRRTHRGQQAARHLDRLDSSSAAAKWRPEIGREREKLTRGDQESPREKAGGGQSQPIAKAA